jgi:hypothetical protein
MILSPFRIVELGPLSKVEGSKLPKSGKEEHSNWTNFVRNGSDSCFVWLESALTERQLEFCANGALCWLVVPSCPIRDGNLGMYTRPDGIKYKNNFLPAGGTRTWPKSRRIQDGYFFSPAGNPTDIWYFTTVMILDCEQVKIGLIYDINYDLLWLLNFATRLSQIFVEY